MTADIADVVIIFGGTSPERDISLDSARSTSAALQTAGLTNPVRAFLLGSDGRLYEVSPRWLASNTIDDFIEFRGTDLLRTSPGVQPLGEQDVRVILREAAAVLPLIHGVDGEDGEFARTWLDEDAPNLLGAAPDSMLAMFDKGRMSRTLPDLGFAVPRSIVLSPPCLDAFESSIASAEWIQQCSRLVIKPARGGSSIGVVVSSPSSLIEDLRSTFSVCEAAVVQEFVEGREFTIAVLQDFNGSPIAICPTGVSLLNAGEDPVYSRLLKYMPTSRVMHSIPFDVPVTALDSIIAESERLFESLSCRDIARFDGFVQSDGKIVWVDLNPIPGMSADSLLYQQTTLAGLDAPEVCELLVKRVARRSRRPTYWRRRIASKPVTAAVLGGGASSERDISRLSWQNVCTRLLPSRWIDVLPIAIDRAGNPWVVGRHACLLHSMAELDEYLAAPSSCTEVGVFIDAKARSWTAELRRIRKQANPAPRPTSLEEIAQSADVAFIALHGGEGEDGTLQARLAELELPFTGSAATTCAVCMDKVATARALDDEKIESFVSIPHVSVDLESIRADVISVAGADQWRDFVRRAETDGFSAAIKADGEGPITVCREHVAAWLRELGQDEVVLKPIAEGSSVGVLVSECPLHDVPIHLLAMFAGLPGYSRSLVEAKLATSIDDAFIAIPQPAPTTLICQPHIRVGRDTRRIEITVAVMGHAGDLAALLPSETTQVFRGLTAEEKFCKGFGQNITPPPQMSVEQIESVRRRVAQFAEALGIDGYARIDAFFDLGTDELQLIEVNCLPGLSTATATFTQASTTPELGLEPTVFLEEITRLALTKPRS